MRTSNRRLVPALAALVFRVGDGSECPGAVRNAGEARETSRVASTNGWGARPANGWP